MNPRSLKILVALLIAPLASQAATIRVDGVVSEIENSSGLLPVNASIGDSFSILYYIQNVGGTDKNPDPQQGLYDRVLYGMQMTIGGEFFDLGGLSGNPLNNHVSVANDTNGTQDSWTLVGGTNFDSPFVYTGEINVTENGLPPTLLTSDAFVTAVTLPLNFYSSMTLRARLVATPQLDMLAGSMTSFTYIPNVPLPASIWLLVSGVLGLFGTGRTGRP